MVVLVSKWYGASIVTLVLVWVEISKSSAVDLQWWGHYNKEKTTENRNPPWPYSHTDHHLALPLPAVIVDKLPLLRQLLLPGSHQGWKFSPVLLHLKQIIPQGTLFKSFLPLQLLPPLSTCPSSQAYSPPPCCKCPQIQCVKLLQNTQGQFCRNWCRICANFVWNCWAGRAVSC